jgi:proliferating cell nuclear antigen
MLVKLENPMVLSKAIDLISELVTEVRIKINEFGLSISAMDPANVSMVGFKVPKSAFSQFESGNEVLGVNLENLKKILKRCSPASSLILEKKENLLEIQIQDRIKRNFSLCLIEIESEDIDFSSKVANMEFSSTVEIPSVDLIDSIEDCGVVADACTFKVENNKFIVEAKGLNSAYSEFSSDEAKIQAEDCKARYSLEYLQKFMKASKLAEKTILKFANDHPLEVDIKTPHMELNFILAPRVETDD